MGSKETVTTSQGRDLGKLKAVEGDLVHLESRDFWLPVSAIETIEDEKVRLRSDYDFLGGPKQGGRSMGFIGTLARLAFVGFIAKAALAYRDEQKRKQLMSKAKGVADKAKTQLSNVKSKQNGNGSSAWTPPSSMSSTPSYSTPSSSTASSSTPTSMSGGSSEPSGASSSSAGSRANPTKPVSASSTPSTPAFSTLDLSNRTITTTETEVTAEVTRAFPTSTVRANAIGVHKGDGGEVGTLRFTVDEKASSDIELSRLDSPSASAEVLAQEVITDLRSQLPQEK